MSTILKALRRLEEDEPRDAAASAGASSPAPASSGDAGEASEGTEGLRDRILAEERANRPAHEAAAGRAVSGETPDADIESSTSALRRFASLAAVALVVFVLGAVVVPALFDTPEPAGDVASAGPDEAGDARIAATGPVDALPPPRSPAPSTPPRASAADTSAASASLASAADTSPPGPPPPRAEVDLAQARAETLARRANPPEALRPAPTDSVAVADLPVAPPSRAKASPRPAAESAASAKASPKPAPESAARTTPRRDAEPPVELALVAPTRTPPPAEAPAAPTRAATAARAARAATKDAPAPRPATSSPPRPSREPTPPRRAEPSASSDRPVAKTSEADPIERVTRPDVPDVTVLRTAWHPDPSRRSARVRLEASEEVLTVKEGDAIGALVLKEISPSAVLFEAGDVEVRRRVGSGS